MSGRGVGGDCVDDVARRTRKPIAKSVYETRAAAAAAEALRFKIPVRRTVNGARRETVAAAAVHDDDANGHPSEAHNRRPYVLCSLYLVRAPFALSFRTRTHARVWHNNRRAHKVSEYRGAHGPRGRRSVRAYVILFSCQHIIGVRTSRYYCYVLLSVGRSSRRRRR